MRRLALIAITLLMIFVLTYVPIPVQAFGIVTSYKLTCSSFSATGETDSLYLGLSVVGPFGIVSNGFPVSGNQSSGTVTFAPVPEGTVLHIFVHGADNSFGDSDGESPSFDDYVPCYGYDEQICPFTDGRLNRCDAGQTVAIYCAPDGSVTGLAIYKGAGYPGIVATAAEISSVLIHPSTNTLIKQGNGVRLYRLTSGELQINRREDGEVAKEYKYIFTCEPKK